MADRLVRHVQTVRGIANRAEAGERLVLKGKKDTVSLNRKFTTALHSSLVQLVQDRETLYLDEIALELTGRHEVEVSVKDVSRALQEVGWTKKKANLFAKQQLPSMFTSHH